jgi:hypothetical protein
VVLLIPWPWFKTPDITMPTTVRPSGSVLEWPTPSGRLAQRLALPERSISDGTRWRGTNAVGGGVGWLIVPFRPATDSSAGTRAG